MHDGVIHTSHLRHIVLSLAFACLSWSATAQDSFPAHGDTIPNFTREPTDISAQDGAWNDPATWLDGTVPNDADRVLVNHVVPISGVAEADSIGVKGVLRFTDGATLKVANLQIQPGGLVDSDGQEISGALIFKDKPLDIKDDGVGIFDPFQFGTGLTCIDGGFKPWGVTKTAFVRLGDEVRAGDVDLALSEAPIGWKAGDRLVIPDTREARTGASQMDYPIIGAPVADNGVILALAAQSDHFGARDNTGALRFLPHVGNLTRSFVIRSENPNGTRGHMLFTGHCDLDIRNVAIVGLGRTLPTRIGVTIPHNTLPNIYMIGSNQIGRYPLHMHHLHGVLQPNGYQATVKGVVLDDCRKWCEAVHNTDFTLTEDTIAHGATGAAFVFEAGNERGNMWRRNFAVNTSGVGDQTNTDRRGISDQHDNAHSGDAYWSRTQANSYVGNVAATCRWAGFQVFSRRSHVGKAMDLVYNAWGVSSPLMVPLKQGDHPTMKFDARQAVPFEFSDNEAYACGRGFEWWYAWVAIVNDSRAWHISRFPIFLQYHGILLLSDFTAIGEPGGTGEGMVGQHGNSLQARNVEIDNQASNFRMEPNKKGLKFDNVRFNGVEQTSPLYKPLLAVVPAAESTVSGTVTLNVISPFLGKITVNVNGKSIGTDSSVPYQIKWDTRKYPNGTAWIAIEQGDAVAFVSGRYFVSN